MNCIKSDKKAKDKIKGKTLNKGECERMIKKIAWETFKKTGNIDTFMELKQIEGLEGQFLKATEQEAEKGYVNKSIILNNSNEDYD